MARRELTDWTLSYKDWDPAEEPLREALTVLGNGLFATRGAAEEAAAGGVHYPGKYLSSGYDRLESAVAGRTIENEDLVNWPNWLRPLAGAAYDARYDDGLFRERMAGAGADRI